MAGWEHVAMGERVNSDGSKLDGKAKAWQALGTACVQFLLPLAPLRHRRLPWSLIPNTHVLLHLWRGHRQAGETC